MTHDELNGRHQISIWITYFIQYTKEHSIFKFAVWKKELQLIICWAKKWTGKFEKKKQEYYMYESPITQVFARNTGQPYLLNEH